MLFVPNSFVYLAVSGLSCGKVIDLRYGAWCLWLGRVNY